MKTKTIIEEFGICQIFVHKYDGDIMYYTVEICNIEIFHCSSLDNCYTRANSINSYNPISKTLDILRAKGE